MREVKDEEQRDAGDIRTWRIFIKRIGQIERKKRLLEVSSRATIVLFALSKAR